MLVGWHLKLNKRQSEVSAGVPVHLPWRSGVRRLGIWPAARQVLDETFRELFGLGVDLVATDSPPPNFRKSISFDELKRSPSVWSTVVPRHRPNVGVRKHMYT